jgi:hypothetical protein
VQRYFFTCCSSTASPKATTRYICGTTKLGSLKFSDADAEADWANGWLSAKPARSASTEEIADAALLDISRFPRKSNRYYN